MLYSAQLKDGLRLDEGFVLRIQDDERRERAGFAIVLTVESPRPTSALANGRSSAGSKPSYWIWGKARWMGDSAGGADGCSTSAGSEQASVGVEDEDAISKYRLTFVKHGVE